MAEHTLTRTLTLALPRHCVFDFFADAGNLERITPPELNFHIVTKQPIEVGQGTLIDYKLRLRGLPMKWRTEISVWDPPNEFVDRQLSGPYRQWIHEHTFEARDGGTLAGDVVHYAVPFDFIAHRWLVRPDVEKIFKYRSEALQQRFASAAK